MNFLDIALQCAARGWHVHPLKPGNKIPITPHGKLDATTDEEQIRIWWTKLPNANVGISCGPSGLCVLDVDHGLTDLDSFNAWRAAAGLPETYTVRTGRRPDFGAQLYFSGPIPDVGLFELNGCSGQVKSLGGLVLAAGCLHPSGEYYAPICDAEIQPTPDVVRQLKRPRAEIKPGEPFVKIAEGAGRHDDLYRIACKLRNTGLDEAGLTVSLQPINEARYEVPLSSEDVEHIAKSASRHTVPPVEPQVVIGQPKKIITDWRELFHTTEETLNAPPLHFLIKDFLQCEGVTGLGAPAGARKTLIAINVARSLVTGEKLFDYFEVVQKPERVLYLCPESSLGPFVDRVKKIGLLPYVNKTFFYRTLSAEGQMELDDPALKTALPGSVVILDTAIRFLKGKENDSEDVRKFADTLFALLRSGAEAVLMLHHSAKGTDKTNTMSLESIMRGSGDLGAFLASCWGTRLQDPDQPYDSASYLKNVKQRDFASVPFEVTSGTDCRLHIVGDPATTEPKLKRSNSRVNLDGMDTQAEDAIRGNMGMSIRNLEKHLASLDIVRKRTWISETRKRLVKTAFDNMQANGGKLVSV